MVQVMHRVGDRDGPEHESAPQVTDDQDRPAAKPVDPDPGRQANQDEGKELQGDEKPCLKGIRVQDHDRSDREREHGDLGPELADRVRGPQLHEIRMAEQAAGSLSEAGWAVPLRAHVAVYRLRSPSVKPRIRPFPKQSSRSPAGAS